MTVRRQVSRPHFRVSIPYVRRALDNGWHEMVCNLLPALLAELETLRQADERSERVELERSAS